MSVNPQIALQVDLASTAIAIVALLISIMVSRRQSRVALQDLRPHRDGDIIGWSIRALDHFCSTEMILRQEYHSITGQAEFEKVRLQTMRDISSCIDQGRLFFPNLDHDNPNRDLDKHGLPKPDAYKGFRHPALDCLVLTYDLLRKNALYEGVDAFEAYRKEVTDSKRKFISEVQSELDPRGFARFLNRAALDNKGDVAKSKIV
jgi:hypothetical protein